MAKPKLELTWIGKDEEIKLEPRILIEDTEKSYGDPKSENMLIHGDNLLALKALEQDFTGKIKCVYIDPPYNTGNAFEHYDDSVEHSIWLSLMRARLILLRNLLRKDGFICCHIDDSEGPYLKVLMDEIFGRTNYLTTFYVQVRYPEKTLKQDMAFHKEIEQIHIYRKEYGANPNLNLADSSFDKFSFYIKEKKPGKRIVLGGKDVDVFLEGEYEIVESEGSENGLKEIWATGTILDGNSSGRFFRDNLSGRVATDGLGVLYKVYGIGDDKFSYRYFTGPKKANATKGKYFQGVPIAQLKDPDKKQSLPIENYYDLAADFGNCRQEGGVEFRSGKKPEKLLGVILKHFSNEGDWVIDSFVGSGSTSAVAHKMNRKWIGIELKDHAYTHCLLRMRNVIDGLDKAGISKDVSWNGGGGFKFYELALSLLRKDKYGNWVIDEKYNANMLAAAMCKHEGFKYFPDAEIYWKQGKSTETDYIFVTTSFMTVEQIDKMHEEMKPGESLLICAKAFAPECKDRFNNVTIKKIPQMILGKCEFGKDNYDLNIIKANDQAVDDVEDVE
ncbi:DNA methyltransferase [candidate division WOR-1 bacterium RIFOXYA12_FULL_52_29]|jgi:adenine-specific DNA-methyltransferase|uniref:DNA methyltransferase n=1 Tax=candidate division WOR-1 bacterium RIFOXYC12_FULL_54_18 TaxID=1802584 RepID=A0A1F4T654_UNCSA|nr:MAG: DNA methyltransferase [candidate division WOR-1 bacterium RIFOXYA2_FULL_51_19]OGC17620.1 MAG: DNA methyltransferase [candidate division WOR-1 bacterium RIFOXYA12_FULL_52_29]OGC26477.1 MAG: DNA methyltransferase [candidate division WOR-1 bacterium RIFOXYB2_FULL_45_9]OGC28037.1 MAG: DNA methyltransferase [candidate division WOR-1 bacterium RIFOXYC12_FULL_54_18]OGC29677.1 MAG: DNA methyltransferase [candidate division WOR-1 bacterium RIFOXYB12_FULL_52_16]